MMSRSISLARDGVALPISPHSRAHPAGAVERRSVCRCLMHAVNCFSFEAIMNLVVRDVPLREGITSDEFRNAMRHLTGGVSVITAARGDDISGMTVTSVASLAVDPPIL